MKILNLYSGLGGNRVFWEGHEVTAVEMDSNIAMVYKANFLNDRLVIADAHQFLLNHFDEFDFIWSSPPCQSHSKMVKATRHKIRKYPDMKLYEEIIFLHNFCEAPFVVENVKPYYTPLIAPTKTIGRHHIWSNFEIQDFEMENHKNFIRADSPEEIESLKNWIGIKYTGNIYYKGNHSPGQVLRNCVHPLLGLHILNSTKNFKTNHHEYR